MKTIRIGIDLGTTNSAIAVCDDVGIEIVKNAFGEETTASILFAEKGGALLVGTKAKKKALGQPDETSTRNWRAEVKRLMGTNETVDLPNLGRPLNPEEASAEILKSLRADVVRKRPDIELDAAVITVPAHFSTVQSEATKRAGLLAGFKQVVLLQEPIAAAICYGLTANANENWLVFDFGGGTFDVALVAAREGHLTVLAHGGDNFLGGKDIDTAIVDSLIAPTLLTRYPDLKINTDGAVFQQLRAFAEQAKIELTTQDITTIDINIEVGGKRISEQVPFSHAQLVSICQHVFRRTLEISQRTISEAHVDPKSIKRVVLVGGPTQMPSLRAYLAKSLGVPIDGSADPLTVVARGAAQFGRQVQIMATSTNEPAPRSLKENPAFEFALNYSAVTSDDVQTITGKLLTDSSSFSDPPYSLTIQSEDRVFSSGELILKNGKFVFQLPTGLKGTKYWLYLKSRAGKLLTCSPDSLAVSKGLSISGAPIPHSIGVSILSLTAEKGFAEAAEIMDIFFPKNATLPLKMTRRFYTVTDLEAGSNRNALPIRVYEGESFTPNRNTLICDIALLGSAVPRTVKKASPVDITIEVNESRELSVRAYLPELDMTLNARATIYAEPVSVDELTTSFNEQVKRNESIPAPAKHKSEIHDLVQDIESTLSKSVHDTDQRRKAAKQVRDLMVALDEAEARSAFDRNASAFYALCEEISSYLKQANPEIKRDEYGQIYEAIKKEGHNAIAAKDGILIKQALAKLNQFYWRCLFNDPMFLVDVYKRFKSDIPPTNERAVQALKTCETAIDANDVDALRQAILELHEITQTPKDSSPSDLKSGITR